MVKTLMTEKQVYKVHKGDNHSARTKVKVGDVKKVGFWKRKYVLVEKIIFKIDTCPHCTSHNTYHSRAQKIAKDEISRKYGNVYRAISSNDNDHRLFHKLDYCLDCHKEFSIEMFIWKNIKAIVNNC